MSSDRIGSLISVERGPERDVMLAISPLEVCSQIACPPGAVQPQLIDHYEINGFQEPPGSLVALVLVLTDQRRIRFYATRSKFDMALLLDELDAIIGVRPRKSFVL